MFQELVITEDQHKEKFAEILSMYKDNDMTARQEIALEQTAKIEAEFLNILYNQQTTVLEVLGLEREQIEQCYEWANHRYRIASQLVAYGMGDLPYALGPDGMEKWHAQMEKFLVEYNVK